MSFLAMIDTVKDGITQVDTDLSLQCQQVHPDTTILCICEPTSANFRHGAAALASGSTALNPAVRGSAVVDILANGVDLRN